MKRVIVITSILSSLFVVGFRLDLLKDDKLAYDEIGALEKEVPLQTRTNEFVSSKTCKACHLSEYQSWYHSFHRTMTQIAKPENIYGDFNAKSMQAHGMQYDFYQTNNQFRVRMPDPDIVMAIASGKMSKKLSDVEMVDRRVVLATGSHHYQTYWVESPRFDTLMQTMPWVYLLKDQKWIPRAEAFMRPPGDKYPLITQWNHHCIRCHSTGGNPGLQKPGTSREGELVSEVGEFGISCEACHGPGEEHIKHYSNPINRYQNHLSGIQPKKITNPHDLNHKRSSEVCGQCHGVYIDNDRTAEVFKYEGIQFRPGQNINDFRKYIFHPESDETASKQEFELNRSFYAERWWEDGSILAGGREYTAMAVSECYTKGNMSCMSCHSMHSGTRVDQLRQDVSHDEMCTQCHQEPKYTTELNQHTKHKIESTGSECINCHMPRTSYALFDALPSHQISSPSVKSIVKHDIPNACNLCHLDKSTSWTRDQLVKKFGLNDPYPSMKDGDVSAAVKWILKGDAKRRAISAWHMGWEPAQSNSGVKWLPPFLALSLKDDYGVVRYIAYHALRSIDGFSTLKFDFLGSKADFQKSVDMAASTWRSLTTDDIPDGSNVLINSKGWINQTRLRDLIKKRDRSPVSISE